MGNVNGGKFRIKYMNVNHLVRFYDVVEDNAVDFRRFAGGNSAEGLGMVTSLSGCTVLFFVNVCNVEDQGNAHIRILQW